MSSLAADLCVPRPDGRRPRGLAPQGGSRPRHRTSRWCAVASQTRPIARFSAQSALSYARLTACTAAFSPWQVDLRARKPARLPGMYARPDARERRRAHGKATAARRGAVGASQARFARLRLGSDSTAARRRGCGVPRAWSPQVQVDWYRSGGVLRRCQTLQERRGRVWRAPVVRSSA